ncbi:uncharacterized protein J8A68_000202, partial [[Candida] subhashii]
MGQSMMGVLIVMIINPKNRLNEIVGKMVFLFDIVVVVLTTLVLACTITAGIYNDFDAWPEIKDVDLNEIPTSVSILFTCSTVLNIVIFVCTRYLRSRKFSDNIHVEEYNLAELSPYQKHGWAKLIDLNKKHNSGTSGSHVLSLMENYTNTKLPGMKCKVLRVFRDGNVNDQTAPKQPLEKSKERPEFNKRTLSTAFNQLDREETLFSTKTLTNSVDNLKELEERYKPLSKNQLKKLAKKSKQQKQLDDLKSLENNTEKFYQELITTEALVMITVIEEFDLAERIPGSAGRLLSKWFGKDSRFPLLCIKFGLLGFHWPFKRSTFYCSQTKKPVARATAVLSAISNWNRWNEKCTVLLDPMYTDRDFEAGIDYSGWIKINLP